MDDGTLPIPEGWLEEIEAADAEFDPNDVIPGEVVLEELRRSAEELEAKLAARAKLAASAFDR